MVRKQETFDGNRTPETRRPLPFFYHSFLLKGEEPPVRIGYDERLTSEHILLTCSDFIEMRHSHFTAQSLRVLFQDTSPEKSFFNFQKVNVFGKI